MKQVTQASIINNKSVLAFLAESVGILHSLVDGTEVEPNVHSDSNRQMLTSFSFSK